MDAGELARWTPIRIELEGGEPSIDWCDPSDIAFTDPFFAQSVDRALGNDPRRRIVRTPLAALAPVEECAPGRDPAGIVFHVSRCGSTVVSRLAAALDDVAVIAEPEPLNTLLEYDPAKLYEEVLVDCVRLLFRAYGRSRGSRLIVKLSSWNLRRADIIRRAFPDVPCVVIYRWPAEILASMVASPPGWAELRRDPLRSERLFGVRQSNLMDFGQYAAQVLDGFFAAALADCCRGAVPIEYRELPEAVWTRILPHFGRQCGPDEIARLGDAARHHAKQPHKMFMPDSAEKRQALSPLLLQQAALLPPRYEALERRRRGRQS